MKIHAKRQRGALAQRLGESTPVCIPVRAQVFLPAMDGGGPRFGALVAAMYRAMLALLVAVYGFALVAGSLPQGSDAQEGLKRLHFIFGLAILGLFCLRLVVRLIDNEPHMQPPLVQWQARATKFVQRALYLFLLAMPLAGWLILNASGEPLALYGLELPALVSPDKELATTLKNVHYFGALLGYFLMGLNVVALVFQQHAPSQRLPRPRALPNLR